MTGLLHARLPILQKRASDLRRGDTVRESRPRVSSQYTVWAIRESEAGVTVTETDIREATEAHQYRYGPREWVQVKEQDALYQLQRPALG